ncbi:spindle pole body interacting protein [Teratosphaeria nubilosa]|uniref:Spindle pole body interacting protein n=1 Tax=Teratosphaeria nubilosa TaxID=161662 RepID=A0A6G1LB17_9PEZI|nr:spindle pole body interacting protein [Teratosphaeria nubilosa]
MATVLPTRPNTNSTGSSNSRYRLDSQPSTQRPGSRDGYFPHAHRPSQASKLSSPGGRSSRSSASSNSLPPHPINHGPAPTPSPRQEPPRPRVEKRHKTIKSQYPPTSTEKHVEYILVASFDIDRGSIMEHQYPGPVGGDEHMLAELMLPDQTHMRSQDWTIFFLHKDAAAEDEDDELKRRRRQRRRRRKAIEDGEAEAGAEEESEDDGDWQEGDDDDDDESSDDEAPDGPPLVYVLNLVNTKQDNTVKRGAVVKAMAICTRHSFLHIYKPLLLLALQQYFENPVLETLASLYDAVNGMDLSFMPRLHSFERFILQSTDAKDLFIEKFEAIIAQQMSRQDSEPDTALPAPSPSGQSQQLGRSRYGLPKDTHEFESVVRYANVPVPVKIPVALSPETVGDFSLVKLITTFSVPHSTNPVAFSPTHPHLTTSGALTHPIIVLLNALLTQKRVIFLGHNLPSSDVAEAVLGACALASGGMLRGFTRHAFPYTDLTKIDDLLKVPGFIAGVTNPVFNDQQQWWDVLCDISTGRIRISNKIEQAPLTEGVLYFQQPGMTPSTSGSNAGISAIAAAGATLSAGLGGSTATTGHFAGDPTGDQAFMSSVLKAIEERHGETAIRAKFRKWVVKFLRIAAAFEETVYGASALQVTASPTPTQGSFPEGDPGSPHIPTPGSGRRPTQPEDDLPPEVTGHGYVWPSPTMRQQELSANATRIEGWRNTRSYYNYIQDMAGFYMHRPIKTIDIQHLHDKLSKLRLSPPTSANIYLAICAAVHTEQEILQLLAVIVNSTYDPKGSVVGAGSPGGQGAGLYYLCLGLFHPNLTVREAVAELLGRVQEHEAGRYFWRNVGRFVLMAWVRVMQAREARVGVVG